MAQCNSNQYVGDIRFTQSQSLILPGANARPRFRNKLKDKVVEAAEEVAKAVAASAAYEAISDFFKGEKKDKGG